MTSEVAGKLPPQAGSVLVITALLATIGLVMVYSATAPFALGEFVPPHFVRQLTGLAMGLVLAFVASRMTPEQWRRVALPIWGAAILVLVLVPLIGDKVNGSRRWLTLPGLGFQFQPSEFARWATLVAVVTVLAGRDLAARRASSAPLRRARPRRDPRRPDLHRTRHRQRHRVARTRRDPALRRGYAAAHLRRAGGPARRCARRRHRTSDPTLRTASSPSAIRGRTPTTRVSSSCSRSSRSHAAASSASGWATVARSSTTCPKRTLTSCFRCSPKSWAWWAWRS